MGKGTLRIFTSFITLLHTYAKHCKIELLGSQPSTREGVFKVFKVTTCCQIAEIKHVGDH